MKRYGIGWPRGYEVPGVSPFDDAEEVAKERRRAHLADAGRIGAAKLKSMHGGELVTPEQRFCVGPMSTPDDVVRSAKIRRGSL